MNKVFVLLSSCIFCFSSSVFCSSTNSSNNISKVIPGPPNVVYNDGNETITLDFSDIEFYPVESHGFPLLNFDPARLLVNSSFGLHVPSTNWERNTIRRLIGALELDYVNAIPPGRLLSASDLPALHNSPPGHPLHQGTPDYTKSYGISSLGPSNFGQKKFTTLTVDADFGPDNIRYYSMVRYQNEVKFGRKIIRLGLWQSLNTGIPRHVWLTDSNLWHESSLTPLGRVMTPSGSAILWTV